MTTPAPLSYGGGQDDAPRTSTVVPMPLTAVPTEAQLVVTVAEVASRLGKSEAELTERQRESVVNAITDAQAMAEGEVNRPLFPTVHTIPGVLPYILAPGGMLNPASWPVLARVYDDIVITSATGNPDGTFDLVVRIGIDGRQEEPIRAFVRAHAVEALRLDPSVALGQLAVTSVSAEGQSISYEKRSIQPGAAGALPSVTTLRRYKRVAAYQAPTRHVGLWPYLGGTRTWRS